MCYDVVSVLRKGWSHYSGGHFRGNADFRSEEATGGEDHGEEDVRFFLPHHQGPGGQHGTSGRPAEEGKCTQLGLLKNPTKKTRGLRKKKKTKVHILKSARKYNIT